MKHNLQKANHLILWIQLLFLGALLASCGKSTSDDKNKKLLIVTTTGMIKDAVQHVVGPHAEVMALMGPGVDPHLYKATQGDLQKLTNADIIFYNGLHLEGKMGEVFEKLSRIKSVVAVASAVPENKLREIPGFQGTHDPHIWFDVQLWKYTVDGIMESLQKIDTAHAADFKANGTRYQQQLDSLHIAVTTKVQEVTKQQRVLITAHDAFGYFGDAYDVEVRGLQGISTVSESGLRDVTELVSFIIQRKIKAIFVETSVSDRSIKAVVEGCRQRGWNVKIGGSLYSDAMGKEGTPEGTYVGMVHANVNTIVEALK